jgi:diadenosine tetraphosphate (Ap4A) HIT family hydrolase
MACIPMAVAKDCVFCKIASGQEGRTLYQDEKVIVFRTLRPAAEHHYLICPCEHISNAKSLKSHHLPLVEHMLDVAKLILQQEHADVNKARFGFHWPPFCSVNHLHLHAISPDDRMKLRVRLTGVFSLWMPWFKSVDWLIHRLAASDKSVKASAVPTTTNDSSYNAVYPESNQTLRNAVLPDNNDHLNNAVPAETNISLNNAVPTETNNLQQDCPVTKDFHAAVTLNIE